ncbi:Sodium Bile acid symporter family protein [Lacunisphaera limnophila]|uniref:Sodium Bile acid symporter family protein n=1 Tax=Lacunisphaera limnophila TaxID=1838286 RepID=A0A1D8AR37_9BACT|nr:bile acid:sodium symporter family protein [Lacunisphaera limnophila]AOS43354.1 Sodium Bile acid symporter family protein [Lacunisphaera limnophila]
MSRVLTLLTNAFPVWVVVLAALALVEPTWFTWFGGPWITWGLAVIMLGMGLTLTFDDFRSVTRLPKAVALGFVAQFTIMPFLGWSLGRLFALETPYAVGLILVACCPGGTASNVVTYLARANVCLSVVMTMCSTFAAVALTPLLTSWLAGALVEVDAWGMFRSTVQIVIAPVVIGVLVNRFAPRLVQRVQVGLPLVSVVVIALICASIIGGSAAAVQGAAWRLLGAVFGLHAGGFALGYLAARVLRFDQTIARTVSIEVGMQNSGLGVALARKHFADPLTAVPCAISSVFHSVIGSILAGWWRWRSRS